MRKGERGQHVILFKTRSVEAEREDGEAFIGGVVSGGYDFEYSSQIAVGGMMLFFAGGLVRSYSN